MKEPRIVRRGSFTVEASLLMGVILVTLFLMLQMTLYLTDLVRLDAVMIEDSTYTAEEETKRNAWFSDAGRGFFLVDRSRIRRSAKKSGEGSVTVSIEQKKVKLGFGRTESVSRKITRKNRQPVKFIRNILLAEKLAGE